MSAHVLLHRVPRERMRYAHPFARMSTQLAVMPATGSAEIDPCAI